MLCIPQAHGESHFNCPSLQGVELENQGGGGTALSHWEKRILEVSYNLILYFGHHYCAEIVTFIPE